MPNKKVTVVGGAGNVGATVARSIAEKELADVVIIDIADQKAAGVAPTFSKRARSSAPIVFWWAAPIMPTARTRMLSS